MKPITLRQRQVLAFIIDYQRSRRYPPNVQEVAEHIHRSRACAHGHIEALETKGFISRDAHQHRSIRVLKGAA